MANIISEHLSREVFADIETLLRDFLKVIKVVTLYPEDNPLPGKMRKSFAERFVEVISLYRGLAFEIKANEMLYQNKVIFTDKSKDEALAGLFYGAGILQIEFRLGLDEKECSLFLDCLKDYITDRSPDKDLVSRLWQEQLEYIKYTTVEDLALDDFDSNKIIQELLPHHDEDNHEPDFSVIYNSISFDDKPDIETDKADDSSLNILANNTMLPDDSVDDARDKMGLSLESGKIAIEITPEMIAEHSGKLSVEDREQIQSMIETNRVFDPHRTATYILEAILRLWNDPRAFFETVAICEKVLLHLLENGDFKTAAAFVHSLRALHDQYLPGRPNLAKRLEDFIRQAGDQKHIETLTDIINAQEKLDTALFETYLESLGWESLAGVVGMLGKLVARPARESVCGYLAKQGRKHLSVVANGVYDNRWYVVRNTVVILGRLATDKTLPYLKAASAHKDIRVREETIRALTAIGSDNAIEVLCQFLTDGEPTIRGMALDYVSKAGGRYAFEKIQAIVQSPEFENMKADEQEIFFNVYSRLGGSAVVDHLGAIAGSFSFFPSPQLSRLRLAAVNALAYNRSEDAEAVILKFTRSRRGWLRQAAVETLEHRRRLMYGEGKEQ